MTLASTWHVPKSERGFPPKSTSLNPNNYFAVLDMTHVNGPTKRYRSVQRIEPHGGTSPKAVSRLEEKVPTFPPLLRSMQQWRN